MQLLKVTSAIVAGALATVAGYTTATAQMSYTPRYAGMVASSVPNCPAIAWRIGRSPSGTLHGVMWYDDLSGMSEANGTMNGKNFELTLKSIMGNGPVGTVTGEQGVAAKLTGEGCANATFKPVVLNTFGGGG